MEDLSVKVVRLHRFDGDSNSKLKAFCDIAIGDFIVKGFRVVQGEKGLFLGMPREQGKDGKWYDSFIPATDEAKQNLSEMVLAAYGE